MIVSWFHETRRMSKEDPGLCFYKILKIKINILYPCSLCFRYKIKPTLQYIARVSRLKISEDVNQSDGKSDSFATDTVVCSGDLFSLGFLVSCISLVVTWDL